MLRSLMTSASWHPAYAPDAEVGAEPAVETPAQVPMNERPVDGPGSGRSNLRKQLEKSFEDSHKAEAKEIKEDKKPVKAKRAAINHTDALDEPGEVEEAPADEEQVETGTAEQTDGTAEAEPATAAPDSWTKEAKAEWAKVPAVVQAMVAKREADVTKGIDELKKKYNEIDTVLQPRQEALRQTGHTPATAINQLFQWMDALSQDQLRVKNGQPPVAFFALANTFGIDLLKLLGTQIQQQAEPARAGEAEKPAGELPAEVQAYVSSLEKKIGGLEQAFTQRFGQLENTFAEQSYAKTTEIMNNWAKDKPYFQEVREMMAYLVRPGPNGEAPAVPPRADGSVDLDAAYDRAIYALPEVRTKVLAEQAAKEAAERKAKADKEKAAQQAAAEKARRASVSLSSSAPGSPVTTQAKPRKGKTVRESLMEARAELSE